MIYVPGQEYMTEEVFEQRDVVPLSLIANDCAVTNQSIWERVSQQTMKTISSALTFSADFDRSFPKIKNYTYNCPVTIIEWADGTKTKVSCNPDNADQFTGFVIAIAKKAMGNDNTMVNTYDKFIKEFTKKQKAEAQAKKIAEANAQREAAHKKKREEKARKRRVKRLAKEYAIEYEEMTGDKLKKDPDVIEARKLAIAQYGVPEDFFKD